MDNFDDLFSDPSEIYGGDFPLRPSSSRLHSRRVLTSPLHLDEPRPIRRQDSLSLSRPHIQLTPPSASFKAEENESKAKYSLFGRNFIALPITPEHGEKLLIPKPNHFLKPVDRKNPLVGVYESRPNVRSGEGYHVVKIRKCPVTWTISDIKSYFHPIQLMHGHAAPYYAEGIHIIMSRRTGLPHSDFFVEFPTESQAEEALELTRMKDYKTCKSSQKELMGALFPNFHSNDIDSEEHNGTLIMVRDECEFLVSECRRIRLRRVNCERPFENIISILSKFPWHHPERISTLQRDHIFEMVKLAMEAIRHTTYSSDFRQLMMRLVRAAMAVPLFTEKQKQTILNAAQMKCPKDMMPFVYLPPEELKPYEDVGSPPNSDSEQYRKAMQVLKLENSNLKTELENLNSYVKDLQDKFDQLSQGYKKYKVALANLQSLSILDTSPPDIPEKGFMPRSFSYESAEKSKRQ